MKKKKLLIDQEYSTSGSLPYDIIESILSRLPVKSLHRFNGSAQYPTRDSLQFISNNQEFSLPILMWYAYKKGDPHVYLDLLCYCDGLILKLCGNLFLYMLWNPSCRSYINFSCPYPIDEAFVHGLCYDPLIKDYKVVIADSNHYAVFHCRNNYWIEMKEMKDFFCGEVISCRGGEGRSGSFLVFEMVCFDSRDERFSKLPMPHCRQDADVFHLTCLGGHLCLLLNTHNKSSDLPFSGLYVEPVFLTNENEIILDVGDPKIYILYNPSRKTFAEIQVSSRGLYPRSVPYLDNMFFSSPNNRAQRNDMEKLTES
ncbi:hypothetical protein Pfo_000966 [Paulownia fortunei]|nr:hypothetical protein Pfo_000966 [Paulownia fortunei]